MLAGIAAAQSPTSSDTGRAGAIPTHQLRTRQGSTFFGRLAQEALDTVRFETSGGMLVLGRDMVVDLRFRPDRPHAGRR
jgi:hypothetical protein